MSHRIFFGNSSAAAVPDFATGIDTRLLGYTGTGLNIFTANPSPGGGPYPFTAAYNADLWGGGAADLIEFLAGVVWYDSNSVFRLGRAVAIAPRILLTTEHGCHGTGGVVTWVAEDGTLVTRTILDCITYVGGLTAANSFRVYIIDEELPAEIPITPMLDSTLAGSIDLTGQPVMVGRGNNYFTLHVADIFQFTDVISLIAPTDSTRLNYYHAVESGDSGSPVFAVYNDQLIYLTHLTQVGAGGGQGPNALTHFDAIQAAVDALNSEYGTSDPIETTDPTEPDPPERPEFEGTSTNAGCAISIGLGLL